MQTAKTERLDRSETAATAWASKMESKLLSDLMKRVPKTATNKTGGSKKENP